MVHRYCKRTPGSGGLDLPQDEIAVFQHAPEPLDSKVVEYVPERRIGWYSYGTPTSLGPLCATYERRTADW